MTTEEILAEYKELIDKTQELRVQMAYISGYYAGKNVQMQEWLRFEKMNDAEKLGWAMANLH